MNLAVQYVGILHFGRLQMARIAFALDPDSNQFHSP